MKRRVKKKIKRTFWFILFLLLIAVGGTYGYRYFRKNNSTPETPNNSQINENKEQEIIYPIINKLSLVATGDGLLHNSVYIDAYDRSTNTFDFSPQLALVKDIIQSYDLAYYNQETLFGGLQTKQFPTSDNYNVTGYSSYPFFNSPSAFGDAMIDAGFNLVSLASNHSADCTTISESCINNAYDYWNSKDIVFSGFNNSTTTHIQTDEKNGISYAFLNYTTTLNGLDGYLRNIEYLVNTYDEEKVKEDINKIKDEVDVIIVAMHWHTGAEYSFTPTSKNREITEYLSSLGVDVVLGTYSHCLQPFDIINDTVVFYSLGNFISNQQALIPSIGYKGVVGALASLDIVKTTYEDGSSEIKIENIAADLTYTYSKGTKDYLVVPFSKMSSEYNSEYEKIYNEYSEVLTNLNDNITIKPLP